MDQPELAMLMYRDLLRNKNGWENKKRYQIKAPTRTRTKLLIKGWDMWSLDSVKAEKRVLCRYERVQMERAGCHPTTFARLGSFTDASQHHIVSNSILYDALGRCKNIKTCHWFVYLGVEQTHSLFPTHFFPQASFLSWLKKGVLMGVKSHLGRLHFIHLLPQDSSWDQLWWSSTPSPAAPFWS